MHASSRLAGSIVNCGLRPQQWVHVGREEVASNQASLEALQQRQASFEQQLDSQACTLGDMEATADRLEAMRKVRICPLCCCCTDPPSQA